MGHELIAYPIPQDMYIQLYKSEIQSYGRFSPKMSQYWSLKLMGKNVNCWKSSSSHVMENLCQRNLHREMNVIKDQGNKLPRNFN